MSRTEYGSGPERPRVSSWAVGGMTFAGAMLVLVGSFEFLAGLAAIINDELFEVGRDYAFDLDPTVWGWIHLSPRRAPARHGLRHVRERAPGRE